MEHVKVIESQNFGEYVNDYLSKENFDKVAWF